MKVPNDLLIIL